MAVSGEIRCPWPGLAVNPEPLINRLDWQVVRDRLILEIIQSLNKERGYEKNNTSPA